MELYLLHITAEKLNLYNFHDIPNRRADCVWALPINLVKEHNIDDIKYLIYPLKHSFSDQASFKLYVDGETGMNINEFFDICLQDPKLLREELHIRDNEVLVVDEGQQILLLDARRQMKLSKDYLYESACNKLYDFLLKEQLKRGYEFYDGHKKALRNFAHELLVNTQVKIHALDVPIFGILRKYGDTGEISSLRCEVCDADAGFDQCICEAIISEMSEIIEGKTFVVMSPSYYLLKVFDIINHKHE